MSWSQSSKDMMSNKLAYQVNDCKSNSYYTILINNKILKRIKSNANGTLSFDYKTSKNSDEIGIINK